MNENVLAQTFRIVEKYWEDQWLIGELEEVSLPQDNLEKLEVLING